jgi:DNA-binding NtrC family response regulator
MAERSPVLVASSNSEHRRVFGQLLEQIGFEPVYAGTIAESLASLKQRDITLAICADSLADGTFREVLFAARDANPRIRVIVAARLYNTAEYVEAMSLGADDFIAAPYSRRQLEWIIARAVPQTQKRALAAAS